MSKRSRQGFSKSRIWSPDDRDGTERLLVTPEIASLMLERNRQNRPLSRARTLRILSKMRADRWVFTHQGMAFSTDGYLLDGQHRLAALIEYGKPCEFNITYGLPPEAFRDIDALGGGRNAADLLAIRRPGVRNASLKVGVGTMMMKGMRGYNERWATSDVADFTDWYHDDIIDPIVDIFKSGGFLRRSPILGSFAACARPAEDGWPGPAGNRKLDDVLLPAMRLVAQEWEGARDPMKTLFAKFVRMQTSTRTANKVTQVELYQLTTSALRADLRGRTIASVLPSDTDWGAPTDHGKRPRVKRKAPEARRPEHRPVDLKNVDRHLPKPSDEE